MREAPDRVRSLLSVLIALGLSATAAWSWAEVAPARAAQVGPSESSVAPVTLKIWNRPVVVFRAPGQPDRPRGARRRRRPALRGAG